jgi:DNA helicase-2/ATP-dependent DNA helicase PcrA
VSSFVEGLTASQREAVTHDGGPMIVLAGPGAGKTRVITHRIAHLVVDRGVEAERVLALTFTNKAATEMGERLQGLIGAGPSDRVRAFTFNGFGAWLLRRFADVAGVPMRPVPLDSAMRKRLMRRLWSERGLMSRSVAEGLDAGIERVTEQIHRMFCAGWTAEEAKRALEGAIGSCADEAEGHELSDWLEAAEAWAAFAGLCREEGVMSYDDQIALATRLVETNARVAEIVRAEAAHVVVDEFQDVNLAQIRLLRAIAPPGTGRDIAVVGDDDQSIYGFRGADDRAIGRFEKTWTVGGDRVRTVELGENFRSERCVIGASRAVIEVANDVRFVPGKELRRAAVREAEGDKPGAVVEAVRLDAWARDGAAIAAMIKLDLAESGRSLSDYAVIARSHGDLDRVRRALELEGIATVSARTTGAADDPGVQDVLAWARLLVDPSAGWCVRRLLRRAPFAVPEGVVAAWERGWMAQRSRLEARDAEAGALPGSGTLLDWIAAEVSSAGAHRGEIDRMLEWREALAKEAADRAADEVIEAIIRVTGATAADLPSGEASRERVSSLVALLRFARSRRGRLDEPGDLKAFLDYYDDLDDRDKRMEGDRENPDAEPGPEGDADAVQLLTAHASKGLEFDTVFLPRLGQHGYPSKRGAGELELPGVLARDDDGGGEGGADHEERRLFYVAMTRAERRLVALGTLPKKMTKGVTYFLHELIEGGAVERTADEVIDRAREAGVVANDGRDAELSSGAAKALELAAADERRAARELAAAALDRADRVGVDAGSFAELAAKMASAARRMAAVAAAERGLEVPAFALEDDGAAAGARRIADARAGLGIDGRGLEAMRSPLKLSYSMINSYERCGLCFYVSQVLGLQDGFAPYLALGNAAHRAMQLFTSERALAENDGREKPGRDWLVARGREELFKAWPRGEPVPKEAVEQVAEQLGRCFDRLITDEDHTVETEFAITLGYPHAEDGPHRLIAKLDRVDMVGGGFRIVDYKTGGASKAKLEPEKKDLQLGIYAMAAESRFGADMTGTAEYWVLSTGERGVIALEELRGYREKLIARIDKAVEGMLAGRYERQKDCTGICASVFPHA